jgi:hypothetical protein
VYLLARVTPQALRALPGMESATTAAAALAAQQAAAAPEAAATTAQLVGGQGSAVTVQGKPRTAPASAGSNIVRPTSGAKSPGGRGGGPAAGAAEAAPVVLGPGDIPSDEALGRSNVYSAAEATLLSWLNVSVARSFPERAQV